MAEIGLIASVIQVAGAGLKLSQTLYEYAETVASADRRIKDIAKEVELTSWVIDELGDIFKKESTAALLSKKAAKTADDTVRECYNVFTELEAAIKKTKKNTLGRLMLPFRESKMDLLRSHIDKLKSTLQLLMQVLTHAHQIASHKLDREAEEAQREQIKVLIQGKKESTKRYEESLKSYSLSEQSTVLGDRDLSDMGGMTVSAYSISSTITVKGLETCVQHIQGLLQDIENLQQALSSENAGNDPSEHQQSLVGSYFQAREHLDAVILGSSKVIANVATDDKESTVRAEPRKASAEVYKTTRREEHVKSVEDMQKTRAEVDVERLKRIHDEELKANEERLRELGVREGERKAAGDQMFLEKARHEQAEAARMATKSRDEVLRRKEEYEKAFEEEKIRAKQETRRLESAPNQQMPIKFEDAIGRKFGFPFQMCRTWKGVADLINSAFQHIDSLRNQVQEYQYDLVGPERQILMPTLWEDSIRPGWTVKMVMWPPMPKLLPIPPVPPGLHDDVATHSPVVVISEEYPSSLPLPEHHRPHRHGLDPSMLILDPPARKSKSNGKKSKSPGSYNIMPPPPPPQFIPSDLPPPTAPPPGYAEVPTINSKPSKAGKNKSTKTTSTGTRRKDHAKGHKLKGGLKIRFESGSAKKPRKSTEGVRRNGSGVELKPRKPLPFLLPPAISSGESQDLTEQFGSLGIHIDAKTPEVLAAALKRDGLSFPPEQYVLIIAYSRSPHDSQGSRLEINPGPEDSPLRIIHRLSLAGRDPSLIYDTAADTPTNIPYRRYNEYDIRHRVEQFSTGPLPNITHQPMRKQQEEEVQRAKSDRFALFGFQENQIQAMIKPEFQQQGISAPSDELKSKSSGFDSMSSDQETDTDDDSPADRPDYGAIKGTQKKVDVGEKRMAHRPGPLRPEGRQIKIRDFRPQAVIFPEEDEWYEPQHPDRGFIQRSRPPFVHGTQQKSPMSQERSKEGSDMRHLLLQEAVKSHGNLRKVGVKARYFGSSTDSADDDDEVDELLREWTTVRM